jgi:rfaE bifunctional protein nucleotidyltransferase chain/domain
MDFIISTIDEKAICEKSHVRLRDNSERISYFQKVNDKPWGKEYLAYQNDRIGIWILHIDKGKETSLHCHFKKDTLLIPLSGCFKIGLFQSFKILHLFESLYIPREVFHSIHAYSDGAVLMEIEIYTDIISYTDKNDLLRLKDIYNRDKDKYETSVLARDPIEDEIMDFHREGFRFCLEDTNVSIIEMNTNDFTTIVDKAILLEGSLFINGSIVGPGSLIDLGTLSYSILSGSVKVLCLSNIYYGYIHKLIYSKEHLSDFLMSVCHKGLDGIGLTSGCFDIIHSGHLKNLQISKKMCDLLFVCLSSDAQIQRLKGEKRPINCLIDRINMLIQLDCIDYIILYEELDDRLEIELDNIMNILKPTVWFKGSDYCKAEIMKKHPGLSRIELIDNIEGKSTTNIIKKILN